MPATTSVTSDAQEGPGELAVEERPPAPPGPALANREWWQRLDLWIGVVVVAACCAFVLVALDPRLLLRNTTPSGGDTGAHVWWPAYLRDHLLPFRLAGWSPDYYAGFPAGQFYFPVPALLIVGLDVALPYNVAFKLITALGPVALPAGAYVFGRGLRVPAPGPAFMAVGATAFLFFNGNPGTSDEAQAIAFNQHIMGGNLASMLAGEFSFSLALAFALFFLGTFAFTLRTGRNAWLPAVLFAATVMSHLVVGVFVVAAALIVWLASRPLRSFGRAVAIGGVGALLTAVWTVPLVATIKYTTDMRYGAIGVLEGEPSYGDYLFPSHLWGVNGVFPWEWGVTVLLGIALAVAVVRRRASTFVLVAMATSAALLFRLWDGLGAPVWNLRLVPFWYLLLFLLMGVGGAELVRGGGALAARVHAGWQRDDGDDEDDEDDEEDSARTWRRPAPEGAARARSRSVTIATLTVVITIGALVQLNADKDFIPFWVSWNYAGYEDSVGEKEGQAKAYPEYRALVDTLDELPPGRALWEGGPATNIYGTPLALMLLPYWTDGRIASMEGVYFESAGTTPFHFLTVASVVGSGNASNPVRGLPYGTIADFSTGVRQLQVLGVRYFAAHSAEAKQAADNDPRLRLVATSADLDNAPPEEWGIYRVADSPVVEALPYQPVAVDRLRTGTASECAGEESVPGSSSGNVRDVLSAWECLAVPWFDDATALDRPLTDGGPRRWQHAGPARARDLPKVEQRKVRVSDVRTTDDSVSFRVSRPGVPVMVKTSYFPNWEVHGARGPWRATPNFMVVVPTEKRVTLGYATSDAEWLGRLGTLAGMVGLVALLLWPRWRRRTGGTMAPSPSGEEGSAPPL